MPRTIRCRRNTRRYQLVLMLLYCCACFLSGTLRAAETEYQAVTTVDPQIPPDELSLLVKPLTAEELQGEAEAWMQLLRAKTVETSQAELAVKQKNKVIEKAEEVKGALEDTQEILADVAGASEQARETGSIKAASDARELAAEAEEAAAETADVIEEALVAAVEVAQDGNGQQILANSKVESTAKLTARAEETRASTEQVALAAVKTADAAEKGESKEAARLATDTLIAVDDARNTLVETSDAVTTAVGQGEVADSADTEQIKETADAVDKLAEKEAADKVIILESVNELKVQRTGLIDRLNVVLDELSSKLGKTAEGEEHELVLPYRLYVGAVSELELDVSDTQALWSTILGWVKSDVGGLRLLDRVARFLSTVFAFWIIGMILGKIADKALAATRVTAELMRSVIVRSVRRATYLVGIVIGLSAAGLNVGPILAVVGAAGFVVAFALQNTLSNFASGIMIMIYRPFDVGDVIKVSGITGVARSMNLMSTTVSTLDNQLLVVPNNSIWGNIITNITGSDTRRVDMEFGIDYDDDIDVALRVLKEIVQDHPLVLDEPKPLVSVQGLGDDAVNIICWPWAKTGDYWTVYRDITRSVKERFGQAGLVRTKMSSLPDKLETGD